MNEWWSTIKSHCFSVFVRFFSQLDDQSTIFTCLLNHFKEYPFFFDQLEWMSFFINASIFHYHNWVVVCDGIEPMGDCNHCCVSELLPNRPLNKSISLHVHVGSGFIEHKNPVSPNEGPCKTEQLFLTHRETLGRVGDISLQLVGKLNKGMAKLWTRALRLDSSSTRPNYYSFDCSKGSPWFIIYHRLIIINLAWFHKNR